MEFLQLKLPVSGSLRASVMSTGDKFSHDCGAASLFKLAAVLDGSDDCLRRLILKNPFLADFVLPLDFLAGSLPSFKFLLLKHSPWSSFLRSAVTERKYQFHYVNPFYQQLQHMAKEVASLKLVNISVV